MTPCGASPPAAPTPTNQAATLLLAAEEAAAEEVVAEEVVAEEFLQELTSVIRVMEKVSAQYAMVRAGAVHTNVGLAKVQVDASSVTGEDTFTRIMEAAARQAVHLRVAVRLVVHQAVHLQVAAAQQENVPFVEVLVNVCPPVMIVSIVMGLVHVRLVMEEVIIGLQVLR